MRFVRPRRLWWLAVVQVLALVLTTLLPAVSMAATPPPNDAQAIDILKAYRIVRGDEQGNLNLDKKITRAELAAIAIRAMGKENLVTAYRGMGLFIDSAGHWADGELSLAKSIGLMQGDGNGYVRPQDNITYPEALVMILRIVQREPQAGDWPFNVVVAAAELGIIPPSVSPEDARGGTAIRGSVFTALARAITTVKSSSQLSYLQIYLDSTPPVLTVAPVAPTTAADKVTVTGSVQDAAAVTVTVNGKPAAITAASFQAQVSLTAGVNTITVEAADLAGNVATRTLSITRASGVARLEILGPGQVAPGSKATYAVKAYSANGDSISVDGLSVRVEGGIGTFDTATRTFTAGAIAGTGKLVFTVGDVTKSFDVQVTADAASAVGLRVEQVNSGRSISVGKSMTVAVSVIDKDGAIVTSDYGRSISMTASGLSGATLSSSIASTVAGQATFTVTSINQGTVSFTAITAGLASASGSGKFGSTTRVVLVAETKSFPIGSTVTSSRIRAELRDQNDQLVNNNTGHDLWVMLDTNATAAQGSLTDDTLTIKQGMSTSTLSGDDGRFEIGAEAGTVTISGKLTSDHNFTVDSDNITINRPSTGNGTKLQVINLSRTKVINAEQEFVIRVVDKNGVTIDDGRSYAFQVKATTSNNDTKENGIPQNATVRLGNSVMVPVDDGVVEGRTGDSDDVIARTVHGSASVVVTYGRSGSLTLTAVPVSSTSKAYNTDGDEGTALSTSGFEAGSDTGFWGLQGTGLKVTVDSDLGTDQEAGATRNSTGRTFTVRAWVIDGNGDWVPGDSTTRITLVADPGNLATTPPSVANRTRKVTNGQTEFRVTATSTAGSDTYHVETTGALLPSDDVTLQTDNTAPSQPDILVVRGAKGDIAGVPNQIAADEDTMEVEIGQIAGEGWVSAVLYRDGYSTPLATSNAMNLGAANGLARFPKSALYTRDAKYRIALKNGWGIGEKSGASETVVMGSTTSSIYINSVKYSYDSADTEGTLTITGSGFSSDGTVNGSRLLLDDANGSTMDLSGIPYDIVSTSTIVFHMVVDPSQFSGADVVLDASAGWFSKQNAQAAGADTGNKVTPLVRLDSVVFDAVTNALTFKGAGFSSGSIDIGGSGTSSSKVWIVGQAGSKIQLNSTNAKTASNKSDGSFTVGLTSAGITALAGAAYNSGITLEANDGWIYDGAAKAPGLLGPPVVTVKSKVSVLSAKYFRAAGATPAKVVISGSGFQSGGGPTKAGTVELNKLKLVDSNATPPDELFTNGTDEVKSNYEIWITLDELASDRIEAQFGGNNVYFVAADGWFSDFQNRPADGTGSGTIRVNIPAAP